MSGGKWDYAQYKIDMIAESLESIINRNNSNLEDGYDEDGNWNYGLSEETIDEFKKGLATLRKAFVYAHRIDWLLSGDDGEETFHERLKKDLEELKEDKNFDVHEDKIHKDPPNFRPAKSVKVRKN